MYTTDPTVPGNTVPCRLRWLYNHLWPGQVNEFHQERKRVAEEFAQREAELLGAAKDSEPFTDEELESIVGDAMKAEAIRIMNLDRTDRESTTSNPSVD